MSVLIDKRNVFLLTLVLVFAIAGSPAYAASVSGTVIFEGKAPTMRTIAIEADPHCVTVYEGKEPPKYEFLVLGEGQTMGNILVQVVGGLPDKEYPAATEPAVLTQEGCKYSPHVFVVRPGQTLRILNPNGISHNIHAKPNVNHEFNRSMGQKKLEITHVFDEPEPVFPINCDAHNWMSAYCAVLDHPLYDVTETDGKFTIDGLDPGEYEIEAWHERLGAQRAKVTVTEGQAATLDFTFKRPTKK